MWTRQLYELGFRTIVYEDINVVYTDRDPGDFFRIPSYAPLANKPSLGSFVVIGDSSKFKVVQVRSITYQHDFRFEDDQMFTNTTPLFGFVPVSRLPEYFSFPEQMNIFADFVKRNVTFSLDTTDG